MCYPDEYSDYEYLICFDRMNSKGAYGRFEDRDVYVDTFSGTRVAYGESWYCNLVEREASNGCHYYFANPVYKVEDRNGLHVDLQIHETKKSEFTADMPEEESVTSIVNDEPKEEFNLEPFGFVAIGGDMIYSPRLTAARYTVYRSFNGEHFEIIPDANGNIPCIRNSIALESLDDILDCDFPVRLNSIVKEDRILLNLTQ
jgi:hypothetical protein